MACRYGTAVDYIWFMLCLFYDTMIVGNTEHVSFPDKPRDIFVNALLRLSIHMVEQLINCISSHIWFMFCVFCNIMNLGDIEHTSFSDKPSIFAKANYVIWL
uniref:Innexin n=1 Tax=Steinernema glaseri TaxID=37863 RepID=A0A1I7YX39_9BILA